MTQAVKKFLINENMKETMVRWLKKSFGSLHKGALKRIVRAIQHESVHQRIYERFRVHSIAIIMLKNMDGQACGFKGECIGVYEYANVMGNLKYVFIEFIHLIFDMISDMTRFRFFRNILHRLKCFLKNSFEG